ncbi:MAG: hypothetical protein ACKPKO_40820, partial [Candidatus Fonsibacter sp.]
MAISWLSVIGSRIGWPCRKGVWGTGGSGRCAGGAGSDSSGDRRLHLYQGMMCSQYADAWWILR